MKLKHNPEISLAKNSCIIWTRGGRKFNFIKLEFKSLKKFIPKIKRKFLPKEIRSTVNQNRCNKELSQFLLSSNCYLFLGI